MKRTMLISISLAAMAAGPFLLARAHAPRSGAAAGSSKLAGQGWAFRASPSGAAMRLTASAASGALELRPTALLRGDRALDVRSRRSLQLHGASGESVGADGSERFEAAPRGVEQSWTFPRQPPGKGDLEVRIATAGLPFRAQVADGLLFRDRGGSVVYGNATWVDASNRRTVVPARFEAGAITFDVPAAVVAHAAYPAVLDPVISAELPADSPVCGPAAAQEWNVHETFDGTNFVSTWFDGSYRLAATRIAPDGGSLDCGAITVANVNGYGKLEGSAIASDGTRSLVVYAINASYGSGDLGDVSSAWLGADGSASAGPLSASLLDYSLSFSMASGAGTFLAVWDYGNGISGYSNQTYGALISSTGQVTELFPLISGSSQQYLPTVTFDGQNYLVAWTDRSNNTSRIVGTRVSPAGVVLDPNGLVLVQSGDKARLASDGSGSFLVWTNNISGMYGERIDPTGAVLDGTPITLGNANNEKQLTFDGTSYVLAWSATSYEAERISTAGVLLDSSPLPLASAGSSTDFALTAGAGHWSLGWQSSYEIYGVQAVTSGAVVSASPQLLSQEPDVESGATAAYDGTNFFVVWSDDRGDAGLHLYGARFDTSGRILDNPAIAITSGSYLENLARVAFDGSKYVVAYTRSPTSQATSEIDVSYVDRNGTVLNPGGLQVCTSCSGPAVAATPATTLVVWPGASVQGLRLAPDGGRLDASAFAISNGGTATNPAVATDGTDFAVAWTDGRNSSTGDDIYAARVTAAGLVLDPSGIPVGVQSYSDESPSIAYGNGEYLVTWTGYGQNLSTGGNLAALVFANVLNAADGGYAFPVVNPNGKIAQYAPHAAFDGVNFDLGWQDWRNAPSSNISAFGDIYGARVAPDLTFLDRPNIPISVMASTSKVHGSPAIAMGPGKLALLAYARTGVLGSAARVRVRTVLFNDPPVAQDQSVSTAQDTPLAITLVATDADRDALTWNLSQPAHGTLSGTAPALTFTPSSGFTGTDTFTFTANDGTADSNTATVTVVVRPPDTAPVAQDQSVSTPEGAPVAITLVATDAENDPLTWTITSTPSLGTLTGTAPNLTYTPNFGAVGSDVFHFKVNDGQLDSNVATVSITIVAPNQPPVADNQSLSVVQGQSTSITLSGSDPENDPLTFRVLSQPDAGTLTGSAPDLTYTPPQAFRGSTAFDFVANDGHQDSAPATVMITVLNAPPTVTASASPTAPSVGQSVDFTAQGADPGGDALTYSWDFGDGSAAPTGAQVSHSYASAGTFTAVVTCSDGLASATSQVTVVVGGSSGSTGTSTSTGSTGTSTSGTTSSGTTGTSSGGTSGKSSSSSSSGGTGGKAPTSGCGCTSSGGQAGLSWLLGFAALLGIGARRRPRGVVG